MALGKRKPVQQPLFVSTAELNVRCHPFYEAVNKVLDAHHFDRFVEDRCAKFYDDGSVCRGRPEIRIGIHSAGGQDEKPRDKVPVTVHRADDGSVARGHSSSSSAGRNNRAHSWRVCERRR